jgi:hypothetical protein
MYRSDVLVRTDSCRCGVRQRHGGEADRNWSTVMESKKGSRADGYRLPPKVFPTGRTCLAGDCPAALPVCVGGPYCPEHDDPFAEQLHGTPFSVLIREIVIGG